MVMFTSVEICAGAGGQALGLEMAGFKHVALVEIEKEYCKTLKLNRPHWNVINEDVRRFDGKAYRGIDLLAGGVPCPPFSVAGKQLGSEDERDLFPEAIRLTEVIKPKVVMLENVRGILDSIFDEYRRAIKESLEVLGYRVEWRLLNASDYGVPQLRPRVVFVAIRNDLAAEFTFPTEVIHAPTVGEVLGDLMEENGWLGVKQWVERANDIAPTIVGGSKKHGGPDLGPTRAKRAWAALGVDGSGIANEAPDRNFVGMPRLTNRMVARLQGFPDDWIFSGSKTSVYRQIGNAFPPPVACAVGVQIRKCLSEVSKFKIQGA
ncbi:MAG TPA: DNA cytosine methyltransferase [Firmicutes bacterium]|nr:DNA cytosine methyltransferase [Bacillota bacterium]